jgi:hypothetical protein
MDKIFSNVKKYTNNLKDLAIGRLPISISYWQKLLKLDNFNNLLYSHGKQLGEDSTILNILD